RHYPPTTVPDTLSLHDALPICYAETSGEEAGPQFNTLAAEFLLDVRAAQNLVVLKTAPGHASSVAVALDNEEWPEIVGTIAGDRSEEHTLNSSHQIISYAVFCL